MMKTIVRDNRGRRYKGPQPKGRICESAGCATILSIYNDEDTCASCYEAIPIKDRPVTVGMYLR